MREVVESLNEVDDVLILILRLVNIQKEEFLDVSELGFFLDEVLEGELILFQTYVDKIDRFQSLIDGTAA